MNLQMNHVHDYEDEGDFYHPYHSSDYPDNDESSRMSARASFLVGIMTKTMLRQLHGQTNDLQQYHYQDQQQQEPDAGGGGSDSSDFGTIQEQQQEQQQQQQPGGNPHEFVAFLLWYIFLVLCCIVPTCCAYRRRRLVERRLAEQQQRQFQQANMFFFNNNNMSGNHLFRVDEEAIQQERQTFLTDVLKPTTKTVLESDLLQVETGSRKPAAWERGRIVSMHGRPDDDKNNNHKQDGQKSASDDPQDLREGPSDNNGGPPDPPTITSATTEAAAAAAGDLCDVELDLDNNLVLLLPAAEAVDARGGGGNASHETTTRLAQTRQVAGTCVICLCPYEVGDQVTWAAANHDTNESTCNHAFHTSCIIGWLSKKAEPKCPVCRQVFCPAVPLPATRHFSYHMHPFHTQFWTALEENPLGSGTTIVGASLSPSPSAAAARQQQVSLFPFSRSLMETFSLARLSMEHSQQPEQQPSLTATATAATGTTTSRTVPGGAEETGLPATVRPPVVASSPAFVRSRDTETPAATTTRTSSPGNGNNRDPPAANEGDVEEGLNS